ncbi:GNAT family N-acetyltransferase [Blastopirellula marina]|uniref:GNAT family N-acetyltransferase n=1 Tax=Blastopirellula marina TaxID=124 RepID=A0A2S8FSY0_9BACT|nr:MULTISPECIES: GNAT family N-acetyltransferase [Pirellulaceae]PQO35289.1 GNAT family N-acetyltransferase [Blastopirellula marina]RCS53158.1 N-acetyltransferase [Bremerella cremea]
MPFVSCTYEEHAEAILEIFNDAIVNSTALYDYHPRPIESMVNWFATKQAGKFPVLGVVDEGGKLMGFASYGIFRPFPAYKYTVEHSVYIHKDHRGKGLGLMLMQRLIELAQQNDLHVMVGGIDLSNVGSIRLHEKLGFEHSGTIRQAGYKFGRWLDLGFFQLVLQTPAVPVEG